MLGTDGTPFHGQQERSRDSADAGDQQKSTYMHGAQTQQITKKIFGQAGEDEENKREKGSLAFDEALKFIHGLLIQKTPDKGHSQAPGDQKSKEGTQG